MVPDLKTLQFCYSFTFTQKASDEIYEIFVYVLFFKTMTPALLHDTEASKAMMSNMEHTVSAKNKSDISSIDSSKTRESPDVSFDKMLNKENLAEEVHSSIMQDIEIDDSIRLSREIPEVLSDNESERMDENKDAICNSKHIQNAFVFYPIMGFIQMDSILAQRHLS